MNEYKVFEVDGYELIYDITNKKYYIHFNNYEEKKILSEIPKDVFFAYIESKREIKRGTNETERHWEQNEVTESTLYNRVLYPIKSVEDIVVENERNEIIHNAIRELNKSQKRKLIKYYYEEKTEAEIGKEEKQSHQAISKGLKLARNNIKEKIYKKI